MPKYLGGSYFAQGSFPKVGQKQKTEKKEEREKERETEQFTEAKTSYISEKNKPPRRKTRHILPFEHTVLCLSW